MADCADGELGGGGDGYLLGAGALGEGLGVDLGGGGSGCWEGRCGIALDFDFFVRRSGRAGLVQVGLNVALVVAGFTGRLLERDRRV